MLRIVLIALLFVGATAHAAEPDLVSVQKAAIGRFVLAQRRVRLGSAIESLSGVEKLAWQEFTRSVELAKQGGTKVPVKTYLVIRRMVGVPLQIGTLGFVDARPVKEISMLEFSVILPDVRFEKSYVDIAGNPFAQESLLCEFEAKRLGIDLARVISGYESPQDVSKRKAIAEKRQKNAALFGQ